MRGLLIIVLFVITLVVTGCAAKVSAEKVKVFGASTSGLTVQYVDEKGGVVTNKKDDEGDIYCSSDCDPACYFYPM